MWLLGSLWVVHKVKIVGRFECMITMRLWRAIVLSLLVSVQSYSLITLRASDEYGRATTTFNVGIPWVLEVALSDMPDVQDRPTIKGLDRVYARDSSMMTMSINGKSTIKYSYKVRFDTVGSYTIGPATVQKNGQVYNSNTLTINIVDQPTDDGQTKDKDRSSVLFARMKVDKERVMVGEKFKCILRCYYTDQVSQAAPSSSMQLAGFVFEDGVQQANGVETIKGVNYNYFELCWNAYATQAGKKNIPAYSIDYVVNTNPYGSHASAIAMMLGHSFGERKRAYSNVVPVSVDDLPPHNGPLHAIGSFNKFSAKIEPSVAKQGEGMVLTLELVGRGTFDEKQGIELQNIPSEFKYYDSKQYALPGNDSTKYFEFIVQGLSEGQWRLPSQKFTFFDTKTRSYKTLETDPIQVKIIANQIGKHDMSKPELAKPDDAIDADDDIKPIMSQEVTHMPTIPALPVWLLMILIAFPLMVLGYEYFKNNDDIFYAINRKSHKNNAFAFARKEIKKSFDQRNFSSLYAVFVKLFATRCSVNEHIVTQEFIYNILQKSGMHQQELEQWNQFYHQLNELMFFNKQIKSNEYQAMQQYADRWIDRLENIL